MKLQVSLDCDQARICQEFHAISYQIAFIQKRSNNNVATPHSNYFIVDRNYYVFYIPGTLIDRKIIVHFVVCLQYDIYIYRYLPNVLIKKEN